MTRLTKTLISLSLLIITASSFAQKQPSYTIVSKIHLDGDGGWDYLTMDESTGMLYVSHGNVVQVVDVKSGKMVASIFDTRGVHGIAIANSFNKGYISCGGDSSVVVFDLKTNRRVTKVQVGRNPDAILYDPFSKSVFVFNGRSKSVSVIDAQSDKVTHTIPLEGKPEFAATDDKGKIYVNIEDKSMLCMIDAKTFKAEKYWPVAPAEEPSGLAIDKAENKLFVVSDKNMVVMDGQSGAVEATLAIGDRVDGVAFDTELKMAYSANGDGTMTVVQEVNRHKFQVMENTSTQKGARTIAVDSKTHHIYMPVAEFGPAPLPTTENPHPRPGVKPGSFTILDIAPVNH